MGVFDKVKQAMNEPKFDNIKQDESMAIEWIKKNKRVYESIYVTELLKLENGSVCLVSSNQVNCSLLDIFGVLDKNEIALAYVPSKRGTTKIQDAQLLITNVAFYIQPSLQEKYLYKENHICWSDICKYVIVNFERDYSIVFEHEDTSIVCVKHGIASMFQGTEYLQELANYFRIIQSHVYEISSGAKEDRSTLFRWINERVNTELHSKGFEFRTKRMIMSLMKCESHKDLCCLLLLKSYIYTYDMENYIDVAKTLKIDNLKVQEKYFNKISEIIERYITELKNVDNELPIPKSLDINTSLCVKNIDMSEFSRKLVQLYESRGRIIRYYLLIRDNPQIELNDLMNAMEDDALPLSDRNHILSCLLFLRNKTMLQVYDCIKNSNSIKKEWITWKDGYGLTPLHYSIILENDKVTQYLLEKTDLSDEYMSVYENNYLEEVYLYGSVMCLKNKDDYEMTLINNMKEVKFLHTALVKLTGKELVSKTTEFALDFSRIFLSKVENSDVGKVLIDEGENKNKNFRERIYEEGNRTVEQIDDINERYKNHYVEVSQKIRKCSNLIYNLYKMLYLQNNVLQSSLESIFEDFYLLNIYNNYILVDKKLINEDEMKLFQKEEIMQNLFGV